MLKSEFLKIAYKFYPKGIKYLTIDRKLNYNYLNSNENVRLDNLKNKNYNKDKNYGILLIDKIKETNINIELRDATNILLGDRAFNIQHSNFFFADRLKYFPLCFVFSGLIPYYYYYIVDIDISFEKPITPNSYRWVKNNGRLIDFEENKEYFDIIKKVSFAIENKLNYKKFPDDIIWEIIPDICNENIEFENFTFFNAFFMDDFYSLP